VTSRASLAALCLLLWSCALALPVQESAPIDSEYLTPREQDEAAALELFHRNIRAIQERDREAYLACYSQSQHLVRGGPDGPVLGYAGLADGAAATGSDDWPDELRAHDLRIQWLAPGLVYGSYRYQVSAGGVMRFGLSERVFRHTKPGWRIVVSTAFDAPPGTAAAPLALVGATLHDGLGGPPVTDAVVVLREGRIEAAGPRDTTPVPEGVEVVDLTGRFLTPGLIDTHVHYSQTGWADGRPDSRDVTDQYPYAEVVADLERHPERFHRAFLAAGVTTVFDVGGYPWTRRLGEVTEQDPLAPHVLATGPLLATWVPDALALPDRGQFISLDQFASHDSVELARDAVAAAVAGGADAVKVWIVLRGAGGLERYEPAIRAAGAACQELGIPLVVHATDLESARLAVDAGARLLVHSVDDQPVDQAFVDALVENDVAYCPTLTVTDGYGWLFAGEVPAALEATLDEVHPSVAARVRATNELPRMDETALQGLWARFEGLSQVMAGNLATLHEAGVRVVAGTDAGNPLTLHGPSMLPELLAMQAAGLSAQAVLVSATSAAAEALGRQDLGRVAPGAVADLLILDEDPGADIGALSSLTHVVRAGTLHTRTALRPR
jgi:imidazolonepropionase-like amidohydrolase